MNKHKQKIRALQQPDESYSSARKRYLEANDLPADTPTSESGRKRRLERIADEYGDHLGIDVVAPVSQGPAVVVRRNGREVA